MNPVTRRSLLVGSASVLTGASLLSQSAVKRPNILFICSDQHTGSALGASGHPIVKTPNLDRLAARGVSFLNAHSGNPVCVPGRASLMTGMFASDVGSYCNSTPFDGRIPTWGNRLRDAGYHTWATGKLDLCPKDMGFQEVDTSHGHWDDPDITSLFRSPVCFRPKERENADGDYKDRPAPDSPKAVRVIDFLKQSSQLGKPWCAYAGFSKPHPKFTAAARYRDLYPPEKMPLPKWPENYLEERHTMFQVLANFKNIQVPVPDERVRRARSAYFGLITELDEIVGQVLDQLEKTGQIHNTLVVYTSDHGEMLGEHGLWLKNVLLQGAVHVPLIMAGAGLPSGKTVSAPVSAADIGATLVDAAGTTRPKELRGHSLLPLALGQGSTHPGFAFAESHSEGNCTGSFMIRKGDHKYLYFTGDDPLLFDLKKDPGEFHNLAARKEFAPVVKELHGHLTSLLDPDAVTQAAFYKQAQVLDRLVKQSSKSDFYKMLVGRLGRAQARVLTDRCYA